MSTFTCSVIREDMVPHGGVVVFDWDNTLKLYDKTTRQTSLRVPRETLSFLKVTKNCEMYIISAIRPSRINLETIITEVKRLGVLDLFANNADKLDVKMGHARKGNIVICGYDKAEVFLEICSNAQPRQDWFVDKPDAISSADFSRCDVVDGGPVAKQPRSVVFFDDEEVNIRNFSSIVKGSKCYLVQ